jgi:pyrroloquinoline-quinone synthase
LDILPQIGYHVTGNQPTLGTQEEFLVNDSLIDRLQQRIAQRSLLTHPFYQAWQAGELSLDDLRVYAAQYYFFEANFPRFLSAIHARCPDREVRQSILDNLWDEEHGRQNHLALWLDFAAGLDLDPDQVEFTPVLPQTQALLDAYFQACAESSFQQGLAAVYAYESQVPQLMVEKIRGLRDFYGVTDPTTLQFFEVHGVLDEDHSAREAEAIASQTNQEESAAVVASLDAALEAWWGFLDGVYQHHTARAGVAS